MKMKTTRAAVDIKIFCDNSNPSFCAKTVRSVVQLSRSFFTFPKFLHDIVSGN